ncbi:MAE_28990/MAE_18760 family HEPN-like nuclease [Peribacillus butanolivorans]|uniref:MAE_28990/MAE_18760 family HEPN-like nuclease n=1 Tax=Peribacillus butanolivorans TaxID=421767 RepID=UPI0036687EC3
MTTSAAEKKDYLNQLQSKLDKNLSHRKQELTILKIEISKARGKTLNTFLRAGTLLLYSHWEGFIKEASKEYLRFLNNQKLLCSQMKDNFFVTSLKGNIIDISKSKKTSKHYELFNKIADSSTVTFKVNVDSNEKPIIETFSNLKWEFFEEILFIVGLETFDQTNHQIIDSILLDRRNKIAHGERIQLVKRFDSEEHAEEVIKDYDNLQDKIIDLLEQFKDNILDSAANKYYLK